MVSKPTQDKRLFREIIVVLIIKVILLFIIWHYFFDEPQAIDSPQTVADKLFNHGTAQGEPH